MEYITIKEICQKAGVNRSTFYLHYQKYLQKSVLQQMKILVMPILKLMQITFSYCSPNTAVRIF